MANIYSDNVSGSTGTLTPGGTVTFVPSTLTVPSGYTYYSNYLPYSPDTLDREQFLLGARCTIICKVPLSTPMPELVRILTSCGIPFMLNGVVSHGILNTVMLNDEVFYTWTYTKETEVIAEETPEPKTLRRKINL